MLIDTSTLPPPEMQKLLVSSITPRPIAWVSTISADGTDNIAPYSFFTVASTNPPILCFTQTNSRTCKDKDTTVNLLETKECVIHIVNNQLLEQMNLSCAELPTEESEFEFANIETCPSHCVSPLSVKHAPVRFECTLREMIELSSLPAGGKMILVDVQHVFVQDELYNDGMINQKQLDSVGKMGGNFYNKTGDLIHLARPSI